MTFVEQIRMDNADILQAIYDSDFTRGIIQGTLPKESFDFYITQEIYLLYDYIRAAGACASKAADEDIPFFVNIQDLVYKQLEGTNAYYANGDNFNFTSSIAPSYLGYSSYLLRSAYQSSLEIGFAVLYAAPVGQFLISDKFLGSVDEKNPYYPWLAVNSSPNYILLVEEYRRFINRRALENPVLITTMGKAVRTSLFYLYYFFDDCFHRKDFYSLPSDIWPDETLYTP